MNKIALCPAGPLKVEENLLAFVNDLTVIEVTGPDAAEFLQGQVTCDIRQLENLQPLFSACCDYKGRMVANFWIWQWGKDFYILLPSAMLDILLNHFKKFALFSKVAFQRDLDWEVLLYSSTEKNSDAFKAPTAITQMNTEPPYWLHWFIGRKAEIKEVRNTLSAKTKIMNTEDWNDLMILTDHFFIQPPTSGIFIPQMIYLEKFKGVSFNKGCFLGQEVVTRAQHLGQLKRHLHRFYLSSDQPPLIAYSLKNQADEEVGQIVSISSPINDRYQILAVIQDHALDSFIYY